MGSMRRALALGVAIFLVAGCGSSSGPTVTTLGPQLAATPQSTPSAGSVSPQPTVVATLVPTPSASAASPRPVVAATHVPTPPPAPVASPSPDLALLASRYAEIAAGGEAAVVQCNKERIAAVGGNLAKAKAVAQDCLTSTTGYVAALEAVTWGPVQPRADAVIAASLRIEALLARMAGALTAASFRVAYDRAVVAVDDLLVASRALRVALGLPPVQF